MSTGNRAQVEAVMTTPVETISADATIREAATEMRDEGFSALLVPGAEAGIVTSTDVLDAVADGRDLGETTVADLMTSPVESVTADLDLDEAAAMMTTFDIKHLPVEDDDFVGMLSSSDMAAQLS